MGKPTINDNVNDGYLSLPESHQENNWDNDDLIHSWDNHEWC